MGARALYFYQGDSQQRPSSLIQVVLLFRRLSAPHPLTNKSFHHTTTHPSSRLALSQRTHSPARCARAEPRNDSGNSLVAFSPRGHPTDEVSEQTSPTGFSELPAILDHSSAGLRTRGANRCHKSILGTSSFFAKQAEFLLRHTVGEKEQETIFTCFKGAPIPARDCVNITG